MSREIRGLNDHILAHLVPDGVGETCPIGVLGGMDAARAINAELGFVQGAVLWQMLLQGPVWYGNESVGKSLKTAAELPTAEAKREFLDSNSDLNKFYRDYQLTRIAMLAGGVRFDLLYVAGERIKSGGRLGWSDASNFLERMDRYLLGQHVGASEWPSGLLATTQPELERLKLAGTSLREVVFQRRLMELEDALGELTSQNGSVTSAMNHKGEQMNQALADDRFTQRIGEMHPLDGNYRDCPGVNVARNFLRKWEDLFEPKTKMFDEIIRK